MISLLGILLARKSPQCFCIIEIIGKVRIEVEPLGNIDLFKKLNQELGNVEIIAEDLGYITDTVRKLVNISCHYQFIFMVVACYDWKRSSIFSRNYVKRLTCG